MDDSDGLAFLGEKFGDFRITFVRNVGEQDLFHRFGGYPFLTWSLPLGPDDIIDDLLNERLDDLLDEEFAEVDSVSFQTLQIVTPPGADPYDRLKRGTVLQIGSCESWTFAIELYGPWEPEERLLEAISSGTTAVSVARISTKWLRIFDWAEDGVWKGGGEAAGPFLPQVQALIDQAGVDLEDEDSDLGNSLFAPILKSAFGIRLARETLEKPLFTGAFLFPSSEKR